MPDIPLQSYNTQYDVATRQQGDIARYRGLQALSQYMMQPQMGGEMGGGMPPQGPQAIPQPPMGPQGGPPMGGSPMGGGMPQGGGSPMGGAPSGFTPPPSINPMLSGGGMPGAQSVPVQGVQGGGQQGGGFQTPGQGPLTWQQAVQAIQRANPGAPPNVLAAAVDGMIPLMTADSQQQYRQMREQIMLLATMQKPQIAAAHDVAAGERAQVASDTRRDIAQDTEEGRMARAQLSSDTRKELAGLSRDAKMEIENLRQEGALVRANLSAETRKEIAKMSDSTRRELFGEAETGRMKRAEMRPQTATQLKQEQHQKDLQELVTQIDSAIASIDESQHGGGAVTGIGGMVQRGYEFGAGTLLGDDKTPASDFQTKMRLIQLQIPRAIAGIGKIGADERKNLDDIARGLGRFTSPQQAKSSLEYLKGVLQRKAGEQMLTQPGGGAQPKAQQPIKVSSPEEARKLKPGTPYITPDDQEFIR